jgi:signal transduction histidine kinase
LAYEQLRRVVELESERNHLRDAVKAMSHVLTVIGHELRTPLAAIRANAELALMTSGAGPDSPISSIAGTSASLSQMLDDLLEAARQNSGAACWNWSDMDVSRVCEEAMSAIRPLVNEARVRLSSRVEPMGLRATGDQTAICRLITNLLSNARKHTQDGEIELTARCSFDGATRWLTISVRDTGCGMPPEILNRLGEPFALNRGVVGNEFVDGAGLGLSICRGIATAHGGSISVTSELRGGTTVTALLRADLVEPIVQKDAPQRIAS